MKNKTKKQKGEKFPFFNIMLVTFQKVHVVFVFVCSFTFIFVEIIRSLLLSNDISMIVPLSSSYRSMITMQR